MRYLSDEELKQLILDVEQNELVAAPPDLQDKIMSEVEFIQKSSNEEVKKNIVSESKVKEFRAYCFRVLTSAAAAIVIVFMLPELLNTQYSERFIRQETVSKPYKTKEELLNDTSILMQILGDTNIFDNDNKLNIFNGKNGG